MPRAILDPNVLVSALIKPSGLPGRLWVEQQAGAFELIVSARLLEELEDVLRRDKFRRTFDAQDAEAHLAGIRAAGVLRPDPRASNPPHPSDPDDQYLVDLTVATQADALVTGDAALLELRDILPVMSPAEFMLSLTEV